MGRLRSLIPFLAACIVSSQEREGEGEGGVGKYLLDERVDQFYENIK